jgi:hypothetical protein
MGRLSNVNRSLRILFLYDRSLECNGTGQIAGQQHPRFELLHPEGRGALRAPPFGEGPLRPLLSFVSNSRNFEKYPLSLITDLPS